MEALLKASEASALMGLSVRHVQRMAKSGELPYQTHMNERNRPEYLFPLSSLPDAAQQKYFAEHAPAALPAAAPTKAKKADKPAACKPLEAYTAEERGEIGYWITTVDRWQTYRNKAGTKKAECDEKFVLLCRMEEPDRQISVETLYRKWAAIREGDYGALVDMRGKARKGMSKMPEAIERVFLSLFLDESQLPVPRCIALTEEWAQQNMPEAMPLPGYHTFYRKAKAVPYPVMVLCRMGEKKYYDLCSPYIRREYESINANDFWVGDTHTLDVESMGPDGTLHRLYLSAWLDARSGIFTGWYVTDSPGSQATLNALRKGILKFGIKRGILSDAEAVSKTATEINSSAGDYSLSIMDFQHLYYDALQAALRLGDQIGQAYRLCDASAWDADELAVTWGNGVLYDADQEWTERKELVQMGLLKPELALAWKFDLPAESEADLAEIRKNYMPELKDLEG